MSPQSAASAADSRSPSIARPRARALPTRRGRNQVAPESGTSPSLLKAWMNDAEDAATTRSQASARLAPAPAATPFTAAIVGIGSARSASTSGL